MIKNYPWEKIALIITISLGVFSFGVFLSYHTIADGDLWARLAQGCAIWKTGHPMSKDLFAFTPVLPYYVDHEWGAGLLFFSLLKCFGPGSLLLLKVITAWGALGFAAATARLQGARWPAIMLLAIPCAYAVSPGYIPVVRCHALTYLCFAATLFCLEKIQKGSGRCVVAVILVMLVWANVHGGFVSGLGVIAVYAAAGFLGTRPPKLMLAALLGAVLATMVNPYGVKLWTYLWPALTLERLSIPEWNAMPIIGSDIYFGFRILLVVAIFLLIFGRQGFKGKNAIPQLAIMAITAYLAIRHRRHAPFFGIASLAFLGPYLGAYLDRMRLRVPMAGVAVIYALVASYASAFVLPDTTFQVIAPAGFYPARETDILMYSRAQGNVVVPLRWGNYVMWRLYPRVKISMCGRYETVYPRVTYEMNQDFFSRHGKDWDRIARQYRVDYIMLELNNTNLKPEDLNGLGFAQIWLSRYSALYARKELAGSLREIARNLPPRMIQPLDARIPDTWKW